MEKTFKKSLQVVLETSILIFIFVFIGTIPWTYNLYEHTFNRQLSSMILLYLGVLLFIVVIVFLISLLWECKVKNNLVIVSIKGLFRNKTTYSFYNPDRVTIEKSGSFVKSFSNLENYRIYENGKKIVDIEIKKDEEKEIYDLFSIKRNTEKKHYERDKNFVYNGKNFISLFEKPLLLFILMMIYDLFIIGLFKVWDYKVSFVNMNIVLFTGLILFVTSIIYGIFHFIHNSNTNLKINEDSIVSKKGRIFFSELEAPVYKSNSYIIKFGLLSKMLDIYYIMFKLNSARKMVLPLHRESLSLDYGDSFKNRFGKCKKYLFTIILISIFGLGISTLLFFYSIVCGIIILVLTLYLIYRELYSDFSLNNNRIIIRKRYLMGNVYSLDIRDIRRVKIRKVPFNFSRITFYTTTFKIDKVVSNKNLDEIKDILGYFKK